MKLYNATGHSQRDLSHEFDRLGWQIEEKPRIRRVAYDRLEAEGRRVAAEIPANSHVLIGGAQLLIDAMSIELLRKNCRLYAAQTERQTTPDGGFVFNLKGISETPWSIWWHDRAIIL